MFLFFYIAVLKLFELILNLTFVGIMLYKKY